MNDFKITASLIRDWMSFVAMLPCATCGAYGVQLHHPREDAGLSQRGGDFMVIPLCESCHTGPQGVHGDKTMLRIHKTTELQLANQTIALVFALITQEQTNARLITAPCHPTASC